MNHPLPSIFPYPRRSSSRIGDRFAVLAALVCLGLSGHGQLYLSEFLASNTKGLQDEDGAFSDWVEIGNAGAAPVNLEGWFLSNSTNTPAQWKFPSVTIPARGVLIVFASGKNRVVAGRNLHTSFSLNARGEPLLLVQPDGRSVVSSFLPQYPRQIQDVSYGRALPDSPPRYYSVPTPGAPNNPTGFIDLVADTKFSHDRGFYDNAFDLEITCATPGAEIRYTTNGTPPTATTGLIYSGPVRVRGTTVLRAAAFRANFQPSNIDTHSYLFTSDIVKQAPDGQPPAGWPATWGANVRDYGMDPDIVNHPLYSPTIQNDLKTLPSFSVVIELRHLFDPATGIYANPGQDGRAWERPCSLELIHPDGRRGFQIDAGIRIRGGFSRSTSNPKHAFRFFFRDEYGEAKLNYPVFGEQAAPSFDNFDLRTFQNYSWSFQGDSRGVFLRDQMSRDLQLAMGHQAERGDYFHLYINGMYWGLFNSCERPEASYGETYFGGNKENYDVIKVEAGPYTINATDGNLNAWTRLYNEAKAGLDSNEAYFKVQGRNPDGTPNPALDNLINVPNLIDYMLVILYGGNLDAPISNFLGNTSPNNWYGMRDRTGHAGFRFFAHDAEHTLLDVNQDRTGPYSAGSSSVTKSNPQWIWQAMWNNPEHKILVADHVHRHFFNGGLLTPGAVRQALLTRASQIERAVVAESARWGDAKRSTPFTLQDWRNALTNIVNAYAGRRTEIVLNQLRAKGLYPDLAAPVFSQHGGPFSTGFRLALSAPAGTIYYTTDHTDPRLHGGGLSPTARPYSGPVALAESVTFKSRAWRNGAWSALNEAPFTLMQTFTELLVTEIMYHPPGEPSLDGDRFEFIEIKNIAARELDLSGVFLTNAVQFTFPQGFKLAPGRFAILISDPAGFTNRYPSARFDGVYQGRLSNGGETIEIRHAVGTPITSVPYQDDAPWPRLADGDGFSLTSADPNRNSNPNLPANWRASSMVLGSPGQDDLAPGLPRVVINEVLTHTDPPELDAIELHNPGSSPASIGGWFLSDQNEVPRKFRIPDGIVIPQGGFLVFTERDFNASPGSSNSFSLSSRGEQVYLFSADATGRLTGYSDGFGFPAAATGISFGRFTNSAGEIQFPPQTQISLTQANAGPATGPIVFSEIHYQPRPGDEEFLEIKNRSSQVVRFFDPSRPAHRWRIDGIGFEFPPGFELAPGAIALVVPNDPVVFRSRNSIAAHIPVLGPYSGNLENNGERIALLQPDTPEPLPDGQEVVPYIPVDSVRYHHRTPWPAAADGLGESLVRVRDDAYGDDPSSWRASSEGPSPGQGPGENRPPRISPLASIRIESNQFPASTRLTINATDDGLPNPPGKLAYRWETLSGPAPALFADSIAASSSVSFPGVGTYRLRASVSDGTFSSVSDFSVSVERGSLGTTLIPAGSTWKYHDRGNDLGSAWKESVFDDTAWTSGRAQLGYGDGDEITTVGFGPNAANKFPTVYFRKSFQVNGRSSVKGLRLRLLRDDGAVVYLNGLEAYRNNMPEGPILFTTRANATVSGDEELTAFVENIILDHSALREGANVLAVEVHQVNASSTDLSFDLELIAAIEPENQPPYVHAGPDETGIPGSPLLLRGAAADDGLPLTPGSLTVAWTQVSGPATAVFQNSAATQTTATFPSPGVYLLRLTARDGATTNSDELQITIRAGEDYQTWAARYFAAQELADPAVSGPQADPDGDGHRNDQERLAGTNPKDPASRLSLRAVLQADGSVQLRFEVVPNIGYALQYRDRVETGAWTTLRELTATPGGGTIEVADLRRSGQPERYYRLVTPSP